MSMPIALKSERAEFHVIIELLDGPYKALTGGKAIAMHSIPHFASEGAHLASIAKIWFLYQSSKISTPLTLTFFL